MAVERNPLDHRPLRRGPQNAPFPAVRRPTAHTLLNATLRPRLHGVTAATSADRHYDAKSMLNLFAVPACANSARCMQKTLFWKPTALR